ncbi:hypothetical protein [Pedobacter caeni]|uniref:Uncharacterized protein n=1 Tax=Pedobacter caeni TaxID=288992 RepID=A0A1M5A846_9SPHI|nr:hypothetical protein [Pedobacter caeni]SHF26042.1 hypothetical protein SAMN04488522_102616 [Pedobacter caeni]
METKYIRFTIESLAKHFLFYLLMVLLFGGTGFLAMMGLIEMPSSSKVKGIAVLITLIPLIFFGFSTLDFIRKVISMFRHAIVISAEGITFKGEKEIPWTDVKTVQYHYADGLDRSDCLFLEYNSGEMKLFDISDTDICYESPEYRTEIMNIISSNIQTTPATSVKCA